MTVDAALGPQALWRSDFAFLPLSTFPGFGLFASASFFRWSCNHKPCQTRRSIHHKQKADCVWTYRAYRLCERVLELGVCYHKQSVRKGL